MSKKRPSTLLNCISAAIISLALSGCDRASSVNALGNAADAAIVSQADADTKRVKSKKLSDLVDDEKRSVILEITKSIKYVFPVPAASKTARLEALSVNKTYCEFGADRGAFQKHKGIDIYGFGKEVVAFADGEIIEVGRNKKNFDHGNIIIIKHGNINGYDLFTYYLHVGAIADTIKKGVAVKKGDHIARVDCTGISNEKFRLYNPGSRLCRKKAHLHFQIRISDLFVNPNYFFPQYSESQLPRLRRYRLSAVAGSLEGHIVPFRKREALGSFKEPIVSSKARKSAQERYNECKPLFYSKSEADWHKAITCFKSVASDYPGTDVARKARISVRTLESRLND